MVGRFIAVVTGLAVGLPGMVEADIAPIRGARMAGRTLTWIVVGRFVAIVTGLAIGLSGMVEVDAFPIRGAGMTG